MSEPANDFSVKNHSSRAFGEVLRTELRTVLPDLALPPCNPPGNPAEEAELEKTMIEAIDEHPTGLAALCLSGGGIRSATFALGAMQGLARFRLLEHFHYLSTVSGGGYIGSWLSAWRSLHSDDSVFEALNAAEQEGGDRPQITGLRADSNYLTPTLGLLSADTWTVIALYVRNLLLNWLLFFPFFAGCLLLPHLCYAILNYSHQHYFRPGPFLAAGCVLLTVSLSFAVFGRFRMRGRWLSKTSFLIFVLAPMVASAESFTTAAFFWGHRGSGGFCVDPLTVLVGAMVGASIYAVAWLLGRAAAGKRGGKILPKDLLAWIAAGAIVGMLISVGMQFMAWWSDHTAAIAALGLSAVVISYLIGDIVYAGAASFSPRGNIDREWLARAAGWLSAVAVIWALISGIALYAHCAHALALKLTGLGVGGVSGVVTLFLGSSRLTAATQAAAALKSVSLSRIASGAAVIFALILAGLLSVAGQKAAELLGSDPKNPSIAIDLVLMGVLVGGAFLLSLFVNVNRFSLHALYRNRLVRAFLGSARAAERHPDPFTGFDSSDNPRMAEVVPITGQSRLFHVINTTLNVVSAENPAWQERKAESFVITRQFSGNPIVRYQPTASYGDRRGGISLGTAMAISGAAVSPNQGYNSSPLIGFLLMLFNVRLGWWLGNPRKKHFPLEGPTWGIVPALKELAGATTDEGEWVYLSDGGHFENLGLYEMIRRRCRFIVISDASCDPDCIFEDLGNATRKIYIDFGVSIEFAKLSIQPRQTPPTAGLSCAVGTIKYPGSDRLGWLLYIKPTYHGTTERADVRSYASAHGKFPHESTTEQWFSESQLESYRALGAHVVELICTGGVGVKPGSVQQPLTLATFKEMAERYLG
jgi:Patatin-like phospholipase